MSLAVLPEAKTLPNGASAAWVKATLGGLLALLVVPPHDLLTDSWGALSPWSDAGAVLVAALALGWLFLSPAAASVSAFRAPLATFAAISVASALVNKVPMAQMLEGLRGMLPWMVGGLVTAAAARRRTLLGLLRFAIWLGAVLAVYGLVSYLAFRWYGGPRSLPQPPSLWDRALLYPYYSQAFVGGWRLASTFLNDNYFGVWLAMLIPIAFVFTLDEPDSRRRQVGYATLGLMLVALTWTFSRSAALALVVVVAVLTWKVSRWAPLLLLPVLAAAPLMAVSIDRYRFQNVTGSAGGRVGSLKLTQSALEGNPLLGKGPGTRGLADVNYAKIGYETGALGLGAFGWLLVCSVRPALRRRKAAAGPAERLSGALLASVAGMSAAAIGGEVWETPHLAFYFWMLAGSISVLSAPQPTSGGAPLETRECTTRS